MAHGSRKTAALLSGVAAIALGLGIATASAAPLTVIGLSAPRAMVEPAQVFKRGRPPI